MAAEASRVGLAANACRNRASACFRFAASDAFAKSAAAARNLASSSPAAGTAPPAVSVFKAAVWAGALEETMMAPAGPEPRGHHQTASVTAISTLAPPANHLTPLTRIFLYGHWIPHCPTPAQCKDASRAAEWMYGSFTHSMPIHPLNRPALSLGFALALSWLGCGFDVALGAFLHSSFCLLPSPRGGFRVAKG